MNDGNNGLIITDVDPTAVHDKPYLSSHTITLTAADTGKIFRF